MGDRQRRADGVGVITTSFRPSCNTPGVVPPCFDDTPATVNSLCNQGAIQVVQCFYASGSGLSQNVESGLQFIHGYSSGAGVTNGPPDINSVWLDGASSGCSEYFNATTTACGARLNAAVDLGLVKQGPPARPDPEARGRRGSLQDRVRQDRSRRLRLRDLPFQRV